MSISFFTKRLVIAMSKRKPRLINQFQKSPEFQKAFELYKEKKQGEIEGENTLNNPQTEGGMALVNPVIGPELRVGSQHPEIEGAVHGAPQPYDVESHEGEYASLDDLEELQEEVRELHANKKDLQSDLSEVRDEIEELQAIPSIKEHFVRVSAWAKMKDYREKKEASS